MATAKRTLIDKNIEKFINNNFDKKDRQKDESKHFEWFVNSMHIWHTSSQLYNANKNICKQISLGSSQGSDAFYISINNNEKLYTLQDDIGEIINFLKNEGKIITFYFIQTKKTEHIEWAQFLNLIDLPLNIWKGNDIPQSQPNLIKIQEFIDAVTDEQNEALSRIEHKISILFYTNKNKTDIEKLEQDWSININNKKSEFSEWFSKNNIDIFFRGSEFLNDTYEKMMSNNYELLINKAEVIATEDKKYLIGYFTAKELLDSIAPMNGSNRILYPDVFKNNIRLYLGQNEINKGIEKTLLEEPEKFHLYNNGITITTKEIIEKNSKNYVISPVNIVNGCQTANSIFNASKNPNFDSSAVKIPIKIIVAQDADYETITIRSNTQTGVEAQDLVSINVIQKELQESFLKVNFQNKKFYYKRQKSATIEDNIDNIDFIVEIDDILRAIFSSLMLIPNKVSGYFDQTTLRYLNTVFDEQFTKVYINITILLKFIENYLKEYYPSNERLKYHILYIVYRIIVKDDERRRNIEKYLKNTDDRDTLFNTEECELKNIISEINTNLYSILSDETKFITLLEYVILNLKNKIPQFFEISDKKSEKILYQNVEKLPRVRVISIENFQYIFDKNFEEIIKNANNQSKI